MAKVCHALAQTVKNQGEDVLGAHLHPALQGQPPSKPGNYLHFYRSPYLQPISLQLEAGPEPYPEDADGLVIAAEGPWQGDVTPLGIQLQTFVLVKVDLATCHILVPLNRRLHRYVQSRDTKTVMSSANAEIFARTLLVREIPRWARRFLSSLSLQSRGSKVRT